MSSITLSQELIKHLKIQNSTEAKSGGQKTVFIVEIENQKYALKVIKIADERFEREVRICQQFDSNHGIPKIIRIENYKTDTIILEEFIHGDDLHDLKSSFIGNVNRTIELVHRIIDILEPVWNAKYVHRDLKPQNIRVRIDSAPVVLDFGIARALDEGSLTATGAQPLSWPYASPEQFEGKKNLISYRTDFFSLGVIAYELFTGKLPFGATKAEVEQVMSQRNDLVIKETGNELIDQFCRATLFRNPSDRPRNIQILKEKLAI